MLYKQRLGAGRLVAVMSAALVIVGCASPRPAPVVNRTNLPQEAYPGAIPGQPSPPGVLQGEVPAQADQPGGSADPNLKTSPKGLKRPYGEVAAVDPRATPKAAGAGAPGTQTATGTTAAPAPSGAAQAHAVPAPAVVATTALPSAAQQAPSKPPGGASASPGGAGLLDGVAFAWPAAGTVLQNFDETSSKGLSLGGKSGDVVRSAADGRVIFSGAGPRGYGNLIIVKHDSELLSVYAHNRSLSVKEGESVKRGQKIAELGDSGTDKPKLHFEIRQQGKPIDPLAVLPRR